MGTAPDDVAEKSSIMRGLGFMDPIIKVFGCLGSKTGRKVLSHRPVWLSWEILYVLPFSGFHSILSFANCAPRGAEAEDCEDEASTGRNRVCNGSPAWECTFIVLS